jgi:hypothetical protein
MTGVHISTDYLTSKMDETCMSRLFLSSEEDEDDICGSSCKKLKPSQGPANQTNKETDETCTF